MAIATAYFTVIDEPILEFGHSRRKKEPYQCDPQLGLIEFGPYSLQLGGRWHPKETHLIPIAANADFNDLASILNSLNEFEKVQSPGTYARTDFPGYDAAFRSELTVHCDLDCQRIENSIFTAALKNRSVKEGFLEVVGSLNLAIDAATKAVGNPNAIVVVFLPRDIVTQFRRLTPSFTAIARKSKKVATSKDGFRQLVLFEELNEPDEDEVSEESLYHDLRRALKVRAMQSETSLQILTDSFLTDDSSQPWAGKYWNVSCSLFAKAGGIPWRLPTQENIAHCGIRFGVSTDSGGTRVLVGVAQVFSASGELVAVRAGQATRRGKSTSESGYFLTESQAFQLVSDAIKDYERVTGRIPDRLLVHKSSFYKDEEIEGIERARLGVRELDLIYLRRSTPLRMLPAGGQPARRGTIVPTSENSALLYLSGLIEEEKSWRGKHIPSPIELVRFRSNRTLLDLGEEVLKLTKMNWNTTIFATREPCTFANATEMIGMMKELREDWNLMPQIKFYI